MCAKLEYNCGAEESALFFVWKIFLLLFIEKFFLIWYCEDMKILRQAQNDTSPPPVGGGTIGFPKNVSFLGRGKADERAMLEQGESGAVRSEL